jgi:hypothetical protein
MSLISPAALECSLRGASIDEAIALAAKIPAARLDGAVEIRPAGKYW